MKVIVSLTVEVDPASWTETYGVEGTTAIRQDVKDYVRGQIEDSAAADECGLKVLP